MDSLKHIGLEDSSMKLFGQTLVVLFLLVLLGALGLGGYFALEFSVELFGKMDFQVATVTIIASTVALLVAFVIARSIRQASKQNQANQLYADKVMTFQRFIDVWGDLFRPGHDVEDRTLNDVSKEPLALDRHLMLYAGSSVVKAHAALRVLVRESGAQKAEMRSQFAEAVIEIRNELGVDSHDLTVNEIQQLLFANFDRSSAFPNGKGYQDLQPRISLASNS
jgi:hypothetical protein